MNRSIRSTSRSRRCTDRGQRRHGQDLHDHHALLRLLLERQLDVGQILVVTYTNAATAELRRKRARAHCRTRWRRCGGARHPAATTTCASWCRAARAAGTVARDRQRLAARCTASTRRRSSPSTASASACCTSTRSRAASRSTPSWSATSDCWSTRWCATSGCASCTTRPPTLVARAAGELTSTRWRDWRARWRRSRPVRRAVADADPRRRRPAAASRRRRVDALARPVQLKLDLAEHARRAAPAQGGGELQSFDDLLQRLDAALRGDGGDALASKIRRRFAAALIDEFQDTDPMQYRIFERIYRPRRRRCS